MKHRILICAALILMTALAAVVFNRAWLEEKAAADDTAPVIYPPVVEAVTLNLAAQGNATNLEIVEEAEDPPALNIAYDVRLTAYCSCEICCGYWATVRPVDEYGNKIVYTSTMERAVQGVTVAVDPEFIPHGSYVYVQDPHTGAWREYRATDTSPETNHVDIYYSDHEAAKQSGYGGYGTVYWAVEPVDMRTLA